MALLSKTNIERITDSLAAGAKTSLAGLRQSSACPVNRSFYELVDNLGNPDLEVFLKDSSNNLDKAIYDSDALTRDRVAPIFGDLVQRLGAHVSQDGSYSTFDSYLTGIGAQVSPAFAAIAAAPSALGIGLSPANVYAPSYGAGAFDKVFAGTEGALTDVTTAAANGTAADVPLFAANGDVVYLGMDTKPTTALLHITAALSTLASVSVGLIAKIWDGQAWIVLTTTDGDTTGSYGNIGTKGFTQSGVIKFAKPVSWERTSKSPSSADISSTDYTPRFYVRLERTATTVATTPVATMFRRMQQALGLVAITAANTATFIAGSGVDIAKYDPANLLTLRALSPISASVTATIEYTNRAGTTLRSAAQSAWSSIAADSVFPTGGTYLALQAASEGVRSVTGVSVVTTATSGLFVVESVQARTEVR